MVKRFSNITRAIRSDDASAAKILFEFTDGTSEEIEITRNGLRIALRAILNTCHVLGEAAPEKRPLIETTPAQSVLVPTEEIHTVRAEGGGLWIMLRVGCQDISIALPDPRAATLLAEALLNPK